MLLHPPQPHQISCSTPHSLLRWAFRVDDTFFAGNTLGAAFLAVTPLVLSIVLQGNLVFLTRLLWRKLRPTAVAQNAPYRHESTIVQDMGAIPGNQETREQQLMSSSVVLDSESPVSPRGIPVAMPVQSAPEEPPTPL